MTAGGLEAARSFKATYNSSLFLLLRLPVDMLTMPSEIIYRRQLST